MMMASHILTATVCFSGLAFAIPLASLSPAITARATPSTFYIVDNSAGVDKGYKANAITDPPGTYFGQGWDSPTLFTIDSSTGYLITADPGQTAYIAFVEAGGDSRVQFGNPTDGGEQLFISCDIDGTTLSCSADGVYSQFLLDGSIANSTDFRLSLVGSNTTREYAYTGSLSVQYAAAIPPPVPSRFYLDTNEGWAVYGDINSSIYAGRDYGRNGAVAVYSLDNSTGYLTTASPYTSANPNPYVAYIDLSSDYSVIKLAPLPLPSSNQVPLTCQIATDGTLAFSCSAADFSVLWLDLGHSTNNDFSLYIGKEDSTGKGTTRERATIIAVNCGGCTG